MDNITPPHVAARGKGVASPAIHARMRHFHESDVLHPTPVPPPPPVTPAPGPPVPGTLQSIPHISVLALGKSVFDGEDHSFRNPSFDIDGGAARVVEKYDRNGDGAIDTDDPWGLGETTHRDSQGISSIAKLAEYADQAGDRDGKATVAEIAAVIAKFEQSSEKTPGRLSGDERSSFLRVFGEEKNYFRPYHRDPSATTTLPGLIRHPDKARSRLMS